MSALPSSVRRGKGLARELAESLGARLRSREIKPGDKLPTESEIVHAYGVSRGVVREALSQMQAEGLVQTQHGIGTFALEPDARWRFEFEATPGDEAAALTEMLELRASVESDAASLAAARRNEDHLRQMQAALQDFETQLHGAGETAGPDFRFHLAIALATRNRYLGDLMGQLGLAGVPRALASSSRLQRELRVQHLQRAHQEHTDIYAAIERQDAEGARAAMRLHLSASRQRLKLTQPGPAGAPGDQPPSG